MSVSAESFRGAAPVFAALGDGTRAVLVARLCAEGPMSIARLTRGMDVTRQAVTKHLHVLEAAGLARARREGRDQVWAIDSRGLDDARHWLDRIERQWDAALDRLKAAVEAPADEGGRAGGGGVPGLESNR